MRLRAQGSSLAISVNRVVSGIVSMTFLTVSEKITFGGMFFALAGIVAVGTVFFYFFLPETKGKSLEEIELDRLPPANHVDTRKSFTDHLRSALVRKEIKTFKDDDSLERGEEFPPELLRAIGESWGSVIVFSQGYAFSRWCLDELVKIMEQREQRGQMVYPIFFHVDPSDFRYQRNYVEKAFKEHEGKYDKEKTQSWRLALEQVTSISGWPLKDQHESVFVEGIVKQISEKLDAEILDEQEVIMMKRNYQKILAMLEIAEDKLYMKEGKAIKVWFDELKDMAYNIGDVLDEWNTAILKSKIERDEAQIPSTSLSLSIKVHNIPSTISLFDGIAIRIKELNKKLEATRVTDYLPLAVDPNSCIDQRLEPPEKRLRLEPPKTTSLIDESDVCGRDHDKNALIHLLLNDNNIEGGSKGNGTPLIAIVGMGGLGKTTLAQLAFNNDEVKKHFPQRIWVCVSDPFDVVRTAKAILESLKGKPSKFNELQSLLLEISQNIEGKKFLLVLDDVWTDDENKWKPLKLSLSFGSKESKILVTTHGMGKLIKLRHLLNKDTPRLEFMPKGMSRLTSLQTLEEVVVGSSSSLSDSFSLADLGNLIHLRGNLYIRGLNSVQPSEAKEALLLAKAGLRELTLSFEYFAVEELQQKRIENDALLLQALQPPPLLQTLNIYHCESLVFPNWMSSLTSLKSVFLYNCYTWESLPPLGKLPLLESLTITRMNNVKKVGQEFFGIETSPSINYIFLNLKELYFERMYGWEKWGYEYEEKPISQVASCSEEGRVHDFPKKHPFFLVLEWNFQPFRGTCLAATKSEVLACNAW
ncbi:hypothetical protein COLO4_34879 [Corchorus olitorius]|uniref:TIR domain-containing protein n=1 Tax=Corchorus olitorius TaxID=93759 RepID=A0A1R3GJ51_9ROSI|nr:hypothetical protein COLO4_34879 [Corchorus olitorius]